MEVLGELGVEPAGSTPPPDAWGLIGHKTLTLPSGPKSLLFTRLLSPRAKAEVARVLGGLRKVRLAKLCELSAEQWIRSVASHEVVAQYLAAVLRVSTYSDRLDLVSADAAVGQLQSAIADGVMYVDGGWQSLVDALRAGAVGAGAEIRTNTMVEEVTTDGRVWQVGSGGTSWRAGAVILAAGGPKTVDRIVPGVDAGWVASAGPEVEAAVLDMALTRPPRRRFVLGLEEPLYGSVHGPPADHAPDGCAALVLARYGGVPADSAPDAVKTELRNLASHMGVVDDDVVFSSFQRRLAVTGGLPMASQGGLAGRPGVVVPDRLGLFAAGDWVGSSGLLADAALASARSAAAAAVSHLGGARRIGSAA